MARGEALGLLVEWERKNVEGREDGNVDGRKRRKLCLVLICSTTAYVRVLVPRDTVSMYCIVLTSIYFPE